MLFMKQVNIDKKLVEVMNAARQSWYVNYVFITQISNLTECRLLTQISLMQWRRNERN